MKKTNIMSIFFCIKSQMKPILYVQIDGKSAKYVVLYGCR